jgi:uncharacterized protein
MIIKSHFIFYVKDQQRSAEFYKKVLSVEPFLDVPGMTEFELSNGAILGLMPEDGIKKLLSGKIKNPSGASGIPRAELYLVVDDPSDYLDRALKYGAEELSILQPRDWGDKAAYCSDPDGHIIGFAEKII